MHVDFSFPHYQINANVVSKWGIDPNVKTFEALILWVWKLSYGRPDGGYRHVGLKRKGTCSTKHAFVVDIAHELGIDLQLKLGFFMMNADNTPAVAGILADAGLDAIPEAHCFMNFEAQAYDITFANRGPLLDSSITFFRQRRISPAQVGQEKTEVHRREMSRWLRENHESRSLDELWSIREACIAALSS